MRERCWQLILLVLLPLLASVRHSQRCSARPLAGTRLRLRLGWQNAAREAAQRARRHILRGVQVLQHIEAAGGVLRNLDWSVLSAVHVPWLLWCSARPKFQQEKGTGQAGEAWTCVCQQACKLAGSLFPRRLA